MSEELEAVSLRLPKSLVQQIDILRRKSTFEVSRTSMIKALLISALTNYRIPNERQSIKEDFAE